MKKAVLFLALAFCIAASAKQPSLLDEVSHALQARSVKAPSTGLVEAAFSPNEGSEELVLKVIDSSAHSIRLAGYSFTSPPVVKALLSAKKRGLDVRVVVDGKGNRGKASVAALNLLANAGIPTRIVSTYAIHHDKYIVSDKAHVETGSFNYSRAAAKSNSENVLVVWNNVDLARAYLKHWQSRWDAGVDFHSSY